MFTKIKNIGVPFWLGVSLVLLSSLHLVWAVRTNLYFSGDDFAVLVYFKNHTAAQMAGEFLTVGDRWSFRKIGGYLVLRGIFDNFKTNLWPYLFTNHLLHTANVLLVFGLVRRLARDN